MNKIKGLLNRIRIRSKKDWVIFWIFTTLIVYSICSGIGFRINDWLRGQGNIWLTNLNEPQSYGQLLATSVIMVIVVEVVLFLCRKSYKKKLVALVVGMIVAILIFGIYQMHCKLIVSVLWDEEPSSIWADFGAERICLKMEEDDLGYEAEWKAALELCRNLTPVSEEEQAAAIEWYLDADEPFLETKMIDLYFSENFGHSYSFQLRLHEGYIYLWRGYSEDGLEITFFEDNGVTKWLNNLEE